MTPRCEVPADRICWEPFYDGVCSPCIDLDNDEDRTRFDNAWTVAASYVYRATGSKWPGECFAERARPCVDRCRCRTSCGCGAYNYLSLDDAGFCLPIVELLAVNVFGGDCCPCNTTEVWRPCDGQVRMERTPAGLRLVRQASDGCCKSWWPTQDLCRPDCGECTWSVDVRTGCCPPPDVLAATSGLAIDIVRECVATGCSLPQAARSVSTGRATFTYDNDQPGSGFWMSMLSEIINTERKRPVEQFAAPPEAGVWWSHVFGPTRYAVVDCMVVPDPMFDPYGVAVCGNINCCASSGCGTGMCGDMACCCCTGQDLAAAAQAFGAIPS